LREATQDRVVVPVYEATDVPGTKAIVIDPRETELALLGATWLRVRPGTESLLLQGMAKALLDSNQGGFLMTFNDQFEPAVQIDYQDLFLGIIRHRKGMFIETMASNMDFYSEGRNINKQAIAEECIKVGAYGALFRNHKQFKEVNFLELVNTVIDSVKPEDFSMVIDFYKRMERGEAFNINVVSELVGKSNQWAEHVAKLIMSKGPYGRVLFELKYDQLKQIFTDVGHAAIFKRYNT
jgi:anaerobic selenocysteine-containing dehydrogenase